MKGWKRLVLLGAASLGRRLLVCHRIVAAHSLRELGFLGQNILRASFTIHLLACYA